MERTFIKRRSIFIWIESSWVKTEEKNQETEVECSDEEDDDEVLTECEEAVDDNESDSEGDSDSDSN